MTKNKTLKKGQQYVVQCITTVLGTKIGLGPKRFKRGDYVTLEGDPTASLCEAYIYTYKCAGEDFPFIVTGVGLEFKDYFTIVPVKFSIIETPKEVIKNTIKSLCDES
jgi:hypothetical protein